MKKIYLVFLVLVSAAPLSAAACKTDLTAIAQILPHPVWSLVLAYHGTTTELFYALKMSKIPNYSYFPANLLAHENNLYITCYEISPHKKWFLGTIGITLPSSGKSCMIYPFCYNKTPILAYPNPLPSKIYSKDKRYELESSPEDESHVVHFMITDYQGRCPIYHALYQQLVARQNPQIENTQQETKKNVDPKKSTCAIL